MNASEFKKLVNRTFAPNIRQLGWHGSGFSFYQTTPNHVVNIFGLQGSWTGGSVCCETAIHFDFIRDLAHKEIDITKITFASCIIRQRLSPKGVGDYHWYFRDKEEENLRSIHQIWEAFEIYGIKFYQDFSEFPIPFDAINPEHLERNKNYQILGKYYVPNQIHLTWLLKEINLFIGRQERAKEFSKLGMTKALTHAESMSSLLKNKKQQTSIQSYIDFNRDLFKI